MAKMIPKKLSPTTKSNAEKKLFQIFETELSDDYVVFHSAWWQHIGYVIEDREADFIIVHPEKGILILEAKGGSISYDAINKSWHQTQYKLKKSPFEQAREIKYKFLNLLRKHQEFSRLYFCIGHFVAFPEMDFVADGLPSESPQDILLLRPHLSDINQYISSVFNYYSSNQKFDQLGEINVNRIIDLISPSTQFEKYIVNDIGEIQKEILQLTEQQFEVLNSLYLQTQCIVLGCAGSGKTQLAIEKIKRLCQHKYTTLLTCKSINLSLYISDSLLQEIDSGYCIVLPYEEEKLKHYIKKFDAVIVDEGQDFKKNEIKFLETLLSSRNGTFYIFQDSNQKILKNDDNYTYNLSPNVLGKNCRNTHQIFNYAKPFVSCSHPIKSSSIDGKDVEIRSYQNPNQILSMIRNDISFLVEKQKIKPNQIVILTDLYPPSTSLLATCGRINGFNLKQYSHLNAKDTQTIQWSNIGMYKGLESDVVLLILEKTKTLIPSIFDIANSYIGITRAKSFLIIYESPEPEIDF